MCAQMPVFSCSTYKQTTITDINTAVFPGLQYLSKHPTLLMVHSSFSFSSPFLCFALFVFHPLLTVIVASSSLSKLVLWVGVCCRAERGGEYRWTALSRCDNVSSQWHYSVLCQRQVRRAGSTDACTHTHSLPHSLTHTHTPLWSCTNSVSHTYTVWWAGWGVGDSTPPCMSCTSRCKQAEHRSENGGRGAKTRQTSKLDELKEEGRGRRERRREKRQGSSILTTCTINNGGSAPLSWEQWGWKGMRFWTCSCRSLLNPNLNMPPTHKTRLPFPPPATLNLVCSLPCFLTHIQSVSHSLLARSHWLTSTEQQRVEHAAHHELNSSAGTGR